MSKELPLARLHTDGTNYGDEVFAVLGAAIRDGVLHPGQRLRDIDLAAALGVSRTPVREAIQRLQRIGLVEVSANRYTRVAQHDPRVIREASEYLVYTVGVGLHMALRRCTDEAIESMLPAVDAMIAASAIDDNKALLDASTALYTVVAHHTGNRVYLSVLQEAAPFFQRSVDGWIPKDRDTAHRTEALRALRTAIQTRDASTAEGIIRAQFGIT